MDKYYGNVCELDIIFNFQKAYFILDELLLAGEMQESSKKNVLRCISQQDSLEDMEVSANCLLSFAFVVLHALQHVCQRGYGGWDLDCRPWAAARHGLFGHGPYYNPQPWMLSSDMTSLFPDGVLHSVKPTFPKFSAICSVPCLHDANMSSPQVEEDVVTKIM